MNRIGIRMTSLFFIWMSGLACGSAGAATVIRGKDQYVLIEFTVDEPPPVVAQRMVVVQNDGKRLGWVEISKVKERKAIARVLKGSAPVGAKVERGSRPQTSAESPSKPQSFKKSDLSMGITLGAAMDQQSLIVENMDGTITESLQLKGIGYRFRAYFEKTLYGDLSALGRAGLEIFDVSGTSEKKLCSDTASCQTKITFAAADVLMKYTLFDGWGSPFLFGGGGLYYPLSARSTIIEVESLAMSQFLIAGAGARIGFSGSWSMPVQLEYGVFPFSGSGHSTRFMSFQTGLTAEF